MSGLAYTNSLEDDAPNIPKKKRVKKKKSSRTQNATNFSIKSEEPFNSSVIDCDSDAEISPSEVDSNDLPIRSIAQTNGNSKNVDNVDHSGDDVIASSNPNTPDLIVPDEFNSSIRFKDLSLEREALLSEVERLRKSLQDVQDNHSSELNSIKTEYSYKISNIEEKHAKELSLSQQKYTEEIAALNTELAKTDAARETAETQYQHLLERVNNIKSSLGERFKADRQELAEAKEQIESLVSENEAYEGKVKHLVTENERLDMELQKASEELSNLCHRLNLSQQNWAQERNELVIQKGQLKEEVEAAKEAMGDWELLAMEERSMREGLAGRIKDLEEQISSQKEALESAISESQNQNHTIESLRRALQEVQIARKQELRDMVESYEEQLQVLKKLVQESDARATNADSTKLALQAELDRLTPFEKEIKEKNLLIGKLRHEAIVLNEHLTKALRFLKKANPADNIDRQIVTNHFLHFLTLDRSDPKKFQILQLIASLLNWTEEQKEQAGLARPGTSNTSSRLGSSIYNVRSSTTSLSNEYLDDNPTRKESLTELWNSFIERSAEEGSSQSRNASLNSVSMPKSDE